MYGVGSIHHIQGMFNAQKYVKILTNEFLPSFAKGNHPFPEGPVYFVHDRCPIHQARLVQEWYINHPHFQLLPWPSKGADCNPIENIWGYGEHLDTWRGKDDSSTLNHAKEVWEMFRTKPELMRRHTGNMQRRLQAVIDREGGWTGY